MATLEKIRSKSVFLIVVIGVALLAFIVGDALTNSRNIFGDHNTVAKLGKTKIDYMEYQRKREELNNQYEEARKQNPEQFANFDTQVLGQMALDQLLSETLVLNAADRAGIRCTPNLLRHYMLENPQNPEVARLLQQLQAAGLSAQTPQQAYDIIFNPKRNGLTEAQVQPLQNAWIAAEKKTEQMVAGQIYTRVLAATIQPNDLDRKALYEDYVATANVDVAFKPFGNLSEKDYPVSDSELKAEYEKTKNVFKVNEATKEIGFISIAVTPSDADQKASQALAEQTANYMRTNAGALSKEIKKEGVSLNHIALRAADIPAGAVKDFVTTTSADSVKLIRSNISGFTVVRMGKVVSEIDSIQLTLVSAATEGVGQKALAALNAGLSADSLSTRFGLDSIQVQSDQWIPLFTADGPTNAIPTETLDSLRNAGGKYITIQAGPQGMLMAKMVKQNPAVNVYEYDEATYILGPSAKTLGSERDRLEKFLAKNNTADKFVANAQKSGFNFQEYQITSSDPAVPRFPGMNQYFPDSRQVVRWVMIDGKDGEVSHIYESKDPVTPNLYVAAVQLSYDEYVPMESKEVKDFLTQKLRRQKAGEKMAAEYQKKAQSLQSVAQAMGVNTMNIPQFRFGKNAGVQDPEVTGKIAGAKADKKVVVAAGMDGVYAFQVMGNSKENFPYNEQMYTQQYYRQVNPDMVGMLKGNAKFKNNIYKFEAGD